MYYRNLLAYPRHVDFDVPKDIRDTLETLNVLFPIQSNPLEDRYTMLALWLRDATYHGLLTEQEHQRIRTALAPLL